MKEPKVGKKKRAGISASAALSRLEACSRILSRETSVSPVEAAEALGRAMPLMYAALFACAKAASEAYWQALKHVEEIERKAHKKSIKRKATSQGECSCTCCSLKRNLKAQGLPAARVDKVMGNLCERERK